MVKSKTLSSPFASPTHLHVDDFFFLLQSFKSLRLRAFSDSSSQTLDYTQKMLRFQATEVWGSSFNKYYVGVSGYMPYILSYVWQCWELPYAGVMALKKNFVLKLSICKSKREVKHFPYCRHNYVKYILLNAKAYSKDNKFEKD